MPPKEKKKKPKPDGDAPPDGEDATPQPKPGGKGKKKKKKDEPEEGAAESAPPPEDLAPPPGDEAFAPAGEDPDMALEQPEPPRPEIPLGTMKPRKSRVAEHLRHMSPTRADRSVPHKLQVDPRTELPIIGVPPSHQEAFRELAGTPGDEDSQIILHTFEEVDRMVDSSRTMVPRVLMLTDQTLFLCEPTGSVTRCTQINRFRGLHVSGDGDNLMVFVGPPDEYDTIVQFKASPTKKDWQVRDDIVTTFCTIYKRMTDGQFPQVIQKGSLDLSEYRFNPPEGFKLVCAPQRTKAHLRKAVQNFESQQEEALNWVEELQNELEEEHAQEVAAKDDVIRGLAQQLEEAEAALGENKAQIRRLRQAAGLDPDDEMLGRVILNEQGLPVDSETGLPREVLLDEEGNIMLGPDDQPIAVDSEGRVLDPKDIRIHELEQSLVRLQLATERRIAEDQEERFAGTFFERDLAHEVQQIPTRPRGGSLHYQGLVEVLQNQVDVKNEELEMLREQVMELDKLRSQLRQKDAVIRSLQAQAQEAGGIRVDDQSDLPTFAAPPDAASAPPYYAGVQRGSYAPSGTHSEGSGPRVNFAGIPGAAPGGSVGDPYGLSDLPPPDGMYAGGPPQPQRRVVRRKKPGGGVGRDMPKFIPEVFKSTLPPSPDQLHVDPRTGLKLIDVPHDLHQQFRDLDDCVIHFFARVNKYGKKGRSKPEKRVLCITDQNIFQCSVDGLINRCSYVTNVEEILTDSSNAIGFKMKRDNDYDMLYELQTREQQQQVLDIIKTLQQALGARPAPVHHSEGRIDQKQLKLQKPQDWQFELHSVRTKRALWNELKAREAQNRERHDRAQQARERDWMARQAAASPDEDEYEEVIEEPEYDSSYAQQVADAYTQKALDQLRAYLQQEFAAKKEEEYQRLRARIRELEQENEEVAEHNKELKMQWRTHRCDREQPTPNIPRRVTEGMYWIPTEPLVIECSTEVLRVQFWDNILITSHPNGFLNVWDINTAELIRTLKDHTARVIAFQYDGVELVSGSFDSTIRRWNVTDGSCLNVVQGHRGQVTCLQFDRHILVSGATDSTIQVWQMDIELRNLKTLRGHKAAVQCLHFENNTLVSAEWGWLFVWDMHRGIVSKALRDDQGGITCIDYRDGYLLTGGQGGVLTMWDVDGSDFDTLEGHTDDVTNIQLEGPYAVTSSADCTIRMWNLQDFKALGVFNNSYPHECKSFQFIANRFVAAERKTVKVWTK